MPVKPVLEIDLNDSAFQRFYALFEEYTDKLDEQPAVWERISKAMEAAPEGLAANALTARESLALAAAQAGFITESLEKATLAQRGLGSETERTGKKLSGLARSTKDIGDAISFVGGWIVRLGAIGGLGAIFSGLGFGELAGAAMSRLRAAGETGLSTGQLASFGVNLQQFIPTSALANAANQQIDITKSPWFTALGIPFTKAVNESPADLTLQEYAKAAEAYRRAPRGTFRQTLAGIASEQLGLDIGAIRNIAANPQAFAQAQRAYYADSAQLDLSRRQAQAMANFKRELDLAGYAIQTDLINKFGPLAPKLTRLTDEIIGAVAAFVNGKGFDQLVKDAGIGLDTLGSYLGSAKFQSDLKTFGDLVGWIADKAKWLFPGQNDPITRASNAGNAAGRWIRNADNSSYSWVTGKLKGAYGAIMGAIEGQESGAANAYNALFGASGRFQFLPSTAAAHLPTWFRKKYGDSILGAGAGPWNRDEGQVQEATSKSYYDALDAHAFKLSGIHNNAALIAAGWYGGGRGMDAFFHRLPWIFKPQKGNNPSVFKYVQEVLARMAHATGAHTTHAAPRAVPAAVPARRGTRGNRNTIHLTLTNTTASHVAVSLNGNANV